MKRNPNYYEYFTQADSPYLDWSWLEQYDMSWIDTLDDERSKDFFSVDFPLAHLWPKNFLAKYDATIRASEEKINDLVCNADKVIKIDKLTIYLSCEDGHHYFSTPYYAKNDIYLAGLQSDSAWDSAETSVYAFVNDWKRWNKKHGDAFRKAEKLSELEALITVQHDKRTECDHEDLGSLGYQHGSTVICPNCGQQAEVW